MPITALLLSSTLAAEMPPAPVVVDLPIPTSTTYPLRSRKRGLCYNTISDADAAVIAPGVSWIYNWFHHTDVDTAKHDLQFIPMAWGGQQGMVDGVRQYLSEGNHPPVIFGLNEPNLKGQAFITPEESATWWKNIAAVAKEAKVPAIGPHMAIGSAANESITATDPISKEAKTYTFMMDYLAAFDHYLGPDHATTSIALHSYGNLGELKWAVQMAYEKTGKPVWVTEYAWWGAPDDRQELLYLVQATDFMERSPYVAGYAWFKDRVDKHQRISLFAKESGKLTALGEAYVRMPIHDPNIATPIPARIEAEAYATMNGFDVVPTTDKDSDGFLDIGYTDPGDTIAYAISVPKAKSYQLDIRWKGPAALDLVIHSKAGDTIVHADPSDTWQTTSTTLKLPAGKQGIQLEAKAKGFDLNWIELK